LVLAAALAAAGLEPQPMPGMVPVVAEAAATTQVSQPAPSLVLPKGTMVRLMITKEVNSRESHPGDRFSLRVDEEVKVNGVTVIPIGAIGWGEIIDSQRTGGVGKSGRINARLLYVDFGGRRVVLDGERQSSGSGGTGQVVVGIIAFGPFGLLMKGNNATLKAGEILNGYTVADTVLD
jgi:hypothetical protein